MQKVQVMGSTKAALGLVVAGIWLLAGRSVFADIYVDAAADPSVADGTALHPYVTIQDAVDEASANDIIRVAEGEYKSGSGTTGSTCASRVEIVGAAKSGIRLIGAGRGKSVIVGQKSVTGDGFDDGNIRCLNIRDCTGVIVSGFTLRGGGTRTQDTTTAYNYLCGGGLYSYGASKDAYLVDCDIEDCIGRFGGGAYGGTLVRCRISGCGATYRGPAASDGVLINSLIVRNRRMAGSIAALNNSTIYNCTVADNHTSWATHTSADKIYNSIVVMSSLTLSTAERNNASATVSGSVLGTTAGRGYCQLVAPAAGDYRPLATSDAIGAADYQVLAGLSLPAGVDALKDFSGQTIFDEAGKITAGAFQAAVMPQGGALHFEGKISVDGVESCNGVLTYAFAAAYPTQFCVRPVLADGKRLFRYNRKNLETGASYQQVYPAVYPQPDGAAWMMPPPDPARAVTNVTTVADTVLWVDDDGSDANSGTESSPYKTLKKAAENLGAGHTLVLVKAGHYKAETMNVSGVGDFRLAFSTSGAKCALFRAVDGPSATFIEGAADPETAAADDDYAGCGSKAVRCVSLSGSGAAIQGFTLCGGHTDGISASTSAKYGAAVYGAVNGNRPQVLDCIISNNVATAYLGTSAIYNRCRFVDNYVESGLIDGGTSEAATEGGVVAFCWFSGNTIAVSGGNANGSVGGNGLVYNSTFVGTPKSGRLVSGFAEASINCIYDGYNNTYSVSVLTNCILNNYGALNNNAHSYVTADPLFADRGVNPLLRPGSPAIGGGLEPTGENYGRYYWRMAGGDVDGRRLSFSDGKPTVGASHAPVPTVFVTVSKDIRGGYAMHPGTIGEPESLYGGKTISIAPADGGRRLCVGVTVNGVRTDFTNEPPAAMVLSYGQFASLAEGGVISVLPAYSTNLYVRAVGGDDDDTGFTPESAWSTLSVAAGRLEPGETLWVLPGTYATGSARQSESVTTASRVVVKSGCRVISTEGAEKTFIVGEADGTEDYGCGSKAVRGAYLFANSLLRGFTVTGGHVWSDGAGNSNSDNAGGGIFGAGRDQNAIADSCVVSNNVGRFGGGIASCTAVNTLISENRALYRGGACRQASVYNCLVRGNIGIQTVDFCNEVMNCTVLADNVGEDGKATRLLEDMGGTPYLYNSLFLGYVKVPASATVAHCAFGPGSVNASTHTGEDVTIAESLDELAVDADGVPVVGVNAAAVDRGNADLLKDIAWTDRDFGGGQRVVNGRMDIGCFEADWRPRYAKDLHGGRHLTVSAVSPEVKENDDGIVTIPSGSFAATLTGDPAKDKLVRARVTGNGMLDVFLNGSLLASVTAADAIKDIRFANGLAENALTFTYRPGAKDSGCAELLRVSEESGLCLIVR